MFVIIKKEKYMEKPDSSLLFRQPMYADKKQWKQFLSIFLLAAGVGFTVAGIIFFFAYNWEDLPKFAKLGIVQTLLVASVLLTVFTRWNILIKQIILTGATFLVGTLFAVFGQIYQTGADAYDLFLGWTLFTILWAFAIRFTPLWLTFIGLLCTTIWLYAMQIVPDNQWAVTLLTNAVTWICASATVVTEWMYQRYPQPTKPLVCQPAFSGDHCACDLSYDGSNLRKGCNRIHSARKYRSAVLGRVMVRMETKEFILSFRHSFCHTDDFTIPVYLSQ